MNNKKYIFFAFMLLFCYAALSTVGYQATIVKEYDISHPYIAMFNSGNPSLVAVVDGQAKKYIINLENDKVTEVPGLQVFLGRFPIKNRLNESSFSNLIILDPVTLTGTTADIEISCQARRLSVTEASARFSCDGSDLDKCHLKLNNINKINNKAQKSENDSLKNNKGEVVYRHNEPIGESSSSPDGYKYIFGDISHNLYIYNRITSSLIKIPYSPSKYYGQVFKLQNSKEEKYVTHVTFVDLQIHWFNDNTTCLFCEIKEDKDGVLLQETYYIYNLINNSISLLQIPDDISSSKQSRASLDISDDGLLAIAKDKLYIVNIDWD